MGITDRVINLAKGYLDKASERWEQLDEQARRELDGVLETPELSAWERAKQKIDTTPASAGRRPQVAQEPMRDTLKDLPQGYEPPIPQVSVQNPTSTLDASYRVLGVPVGSDFTVVRKAYDTLVEHFRNMKLTPGTPEFEHANRIQRRATAAYMLLANTLHPVADRFDRLEL